MFCDVRIIHSYNNHPNVQVMIMTYFVPLAELAGTGEELPSNEQAEP